MSFSLSSIPCVILQAGSNNNDNNNNINNNKTCNAHVSTLLGVQGNLPMIAFHSDINMQDIKLPYCSCVVGLFHKNKHMDSSKRLKKKKKKN